MNTIAFSLWGNSVKYCEGAVRNALLARLIYPGWILRFYLDCTVPSHIQMTLAALGCELVDMPATDPPAMKMAWRFLAAELTGAKLFRDTDSLISPKEKACVDEWLASGKTYHAIRDHSHHYSHPLFGGLWGTTARLPMRDWISSRSVWGDRLDDMHLLTEKVWPIAKDDIVQHCGAGSERMQWGEYRPMPGGDDYGLGVGVTAKW